MTVFNNWLVKLRKNLKDSFCGPVHARPVSPLTMGKSVLPILFVLFVYSLSIFVCDTLLSLFCCISNVPYCLKRQSCPSTSHQLCYSALTTTLEVLSLSCSHFMDKEMEPERD